MTVRYVASVCWSRELMNALFISLLSVSLKRKEKDRLHLSVSGGSAHENHLC